MNRQDDRGPNRRRYRLNSKKLLNTLLSLIAIGIIIAVVIFALTKTGVIAAGAQASDPPPTTATVQGAVSGPTSGPTADGTVVPVKTTATKSPEDMLIVIDPGHGGFDTGAIGVSGVHEADINLEVAKCLKAEFEALGMQVLMTREEETGLGTTQTESLHERGRIIQEQNPDIFISIHMDSYPDDPSVEGAHVLFQPGSAEGEELAWAIQDSLNGEFSEDRSAHEQDLYVLRCGDSSGVLVECGFLSNANEEKRLQDADYQQRIAKAICEGVLAYISQES